MKIPGVTHTITTGKQPTPFDDEKESGIGGRKTANFQSPTPGPIHQGPRNDAQDSKKG